MESARSRIEASILLGLTVFLLSTNHAQAEVWRCPQPNGTALITASEQNPGTCETFRLSENLRPYNPNRYFPEFYYNYYPGTQSLLSREQSFPYHPHPSVEYVPPPAPQHTRPRIMPFLKRR